MAGASNIPGSRPALPNRSMRKNRAPIRARGSLPAMTRDDLVTSACVSPTTIRKTWTQPVSSARMARCEPVPREGTRCVARYAMASFASTRHGSRHAAPCAQTRHQTYAHSRAPARHRMCAHSRACSCRPDWWTRRSYRECPRLASPHGTLHRFGDCRSFAGSLAAVQIRCQRLHRGPALDHAAAQRPR